MFDKEFGLKEFDICARNYAVEQLESLGDIYSKIQGMERQKISNKITKECFDENFKIKSITIKNGDFIIMYENNKYCKVFVSGNVNNGFEKAYIDG